MKKLAQLVIVFLSVSAQAQSVKPLGSLQPRDTNRVAGSLTLDGVLTLKHYSSSDTNGVVGVGSTGKLVIRSKAMPISTLQQVTTKDSITSHRIVINRNTQIPPGVTMNTALHLISAESTFGTNILLDGVDGLPGILFRFTGNNLTNPTAPVKGQSISAMLSGAYNGTGYTGNALNIVGYATENWTPSTTGSRFAFRTTPNGTNVALQRAYITGDGAFEGSRLISDSLRITTDYTYFVVRDSVNGEHMQIRYSSLPLINKVDSVTQQNDSIYYWSNQVRHYIASNPVPVNPDTSIYTTQYRVDTLQTGIRTAINNKTLQQVTSVDSVTSHRIVISKNAGTPPPVAATTLLHLVSADNTFDGAQVIDGVGTLPRISFRYTPNTLASPQAAISGNSLCSIIIGAYTGSGYRDNALNIVGYATENWTPSTTGAKFAFRTTPNGSNIAQQRAFITGDGAFEGARIISDSTRPSADYTFVVVRDSSTGEHKQIRYSSLPINSRMDTAVAGIYTSLSTKQSVLGYTPENFAARCYDFTSVNNDNYPTTLAVVNHVYERIGLLSAVYQPLDAGLTTLAALTPTTNNFITSIGGAWASRTPTQVKATLSLDNVDNTSNVTERAATATLANKRITKRIGTTASSATPTPDADANDVYAVTALGAGATFGAPSGTPTDGQPLIIRLKDNGTARALSFNAAYRFGTDVAAPTTTVTSKTMYLAFVYNSADSKWDCVGKIDGL